MLFLAPAFAEKGMEQELSDDTTGGFIYQRYDENIIN